MQERKTKNYDHSATRERGKAYKTEKAGRKGYSSKSSKASSRRKGRGANGGKKQQRGRQDTAYKIADLLPKDTIKKLKELK